MYKYRILKINNIQIFKHKMRFHFSYIQKTSHIVLFWFAIGLNTLRVRSLHMPVET